MKVAGVLALALLAGPASGQTEREFQEHFCDGMQMEVHTPSGARVDCVTDSHAIEVDFSEKWAEGLGQSLLYSAETGLQPGIILVCRVAEATCAGHIARLGIALAHWRLPVRLWLVNAEDLP